MSGWAPNLRFSGGTVVAAKSYQCKSCGLELRNLCLGATSRTPAGIRLESVCEECWRLMDSAFAKAALRHPILRLLRAAW